MSYRPYPNRDRALKQLARHIDEAAPSNPTVPQDGTLLRQHLAAAQPTGASLATAFARLGQLRPVEAWPVGEYRLSTRPRVVSGGS